MLNSLRSAIDSWFSKFLLGILVLCFAVLWGAPQLSQHQGNGVLKSGDTTLTINDALLIDGSFRFRTSLATNGLQRFLQTSEANALQSSVYSQLPIADFLPLEIQMRNDVVLKETARQLKLGASKSVIRREIGKDPFFRNSTGGFDRNSYNVYEKTLLENYKSYINAENLINQYAFNAKRDQLFAAASGNAKMPKIFYKALNLYQNEKRNIAYFKLTPSVIGKLTASNTDLEEWFKENQTRYIAPEYREITFITLTPDMLKKAKDISEDDIQAFYERNIAQYSRKEEIRKFSILHFKTSDEAKAAESQLQQGKTFDELAKELHLKAMTAEYSKSDLPTEYADLLFTLPKGGVSDAIDIISPAIVHVDEILSPGAKALADVKNAIRQEIARRSASSILNQTYEDIESEWFDGVALAEIATKFNLKIKTVTFDAQGKALDGSVVNDLPQQQQLIQAAFQTDVEVNQAPLAITQGGGYVWYQVNKIIEPRNREISEVRDVALQDWKTEQTTKRLNDKANAIIEELNKGENLDQVADKNHIQKMTLEGLQRGKELANFNQLSLQAIFSGPKGFAGVIEDKTPEERIVFQVTDVIKAQAGNLKEIPVSTQEAANVGLQYDINNSVIEARLEKQRTLVLNQALFNQLATGTR